MPSARACMLESHCCQGRRAGVGAAGVASRRWWDWTAASPLFGPGSAAELCLAEVPVAAITFRRVAGAGGKPGGRTPWCSSWAVSCEGVWMQPSEPRPQGSIVAHCNLGKWDPRSISICGSDALAFVHKRPHPQSIIPSQSAPTPAHFASEAGPRWPPACTAPPSSRGGHAPAPLAARLKEGVLGRAMFQCPGMARAGQCKCQNNNTFPTPQSPCNPPASLHAASSS